MPAAPQGGLDDLLSEALGSNAQAFDASVLTGPPRRKGFWSWLRAVRGSQPGKYREDWGGPLMMVGGGVVILLGILAVALWLSIGRKSADEAFQSAEADYQSGAYAQARGKFESFLEKYPRHPSAPIVRVHLGLTQMRQAVERRAKWSEALRTAKDVLGRISKEETFVDAQADLAGMLPEIANGLAAEARRTRSAKQVAEAREALRLLGKYVPKKLLPAERIREIEKSLDLTSRLLAQGTALDEAVHQIERAIGRGDIKAGYEIRARLVKENPDLANNKKLREAVESLTQAERAAVRYVAEARTAQTQEAEGSLLASEAVATPLQFGTAPGVAGHVLMVLAEGNVYGIDAATGRLLWRRHVGFETSFLPHPVSPDAASDAILVDAQRGELLRIESPTGSLRWRHALASGVHIYPTVLRDTVLAATDQGHLVAIVLATGASNGRMEFPQPLAAAAAEEEQVAAQRVLARDAAGQLGQAVEGAAHVRRGHRQPDPHRRALVQLRERGQADHAEAPGASASMARTRSARSWRSKPRRSSRRRSPGRSSSMGGQDVGAATPRAAPSPCAAPPATSASPSSTTPPPSSPEKSSPPSKPARTGPSNAPEP